METSRKDYYFLLLVIVNIVIYRYAKSNGLSSFGTFIYNVFMLCCCKVLLEKKFQFTFSNPNENLMETFFRGIVYGGLFAVVVISSMKIILKMETPNFSISMILNSEMLKFIFFQCFVAVSEELTYRFYLYEELCCLKIRKWMSILICSLIFAFLHFYIHGRYLQLVIAFVFSLFMFYLKEKGNSCYLLSVIHFTYNVTNKFL